MSTPNPHAHTVNDPRPPISDGPVRLALTVQDAQWVLAALNASRAGVADPDIDATLRRLAGDVQDAIDRVPM